MTEANRVSLPDRGLNNSCSFIPSCIKCGYTSQLVIVTSARTVNLSL